MHENFASLKSDTDHKMGHAVDKLGRELSGLRTGRASIALLDGVMVVAYGASVPLNQVASLSTPDARTIGVSVWDRANVQAVEKAIRESDLGLNPNSDGTLIRISIPPLTEERRRELTKVAGGYGEDAKVAVRLIRKDAMEEAREIEKSEDQQRLNEAEIQKLTDRRIAEIEGLVKSKQADIMSIS
ncbi:MAG: ribosome recycling factor [Rickettsiales bacterium]|jgi:ribosome recycling factor|nr:ribosome recycling factor [Rickettsiales bacterium]